jgi:hypothetical protein
MSRFDRSAIRLLRAAYRHHSDPMILTYKDGTVQAINAVLLRAVELIDNDSGLVHQVDTLSCIKKDLEQRLRQGSQVAHLGEVYTTGLQLKDNGYEITVALA